MPPPQTRSRFSPAPTAWSMRRASRARVTRVSRWSSGIQLAPLTKSGRPLTTNVNGVPCSSGVVSTATLRSPIRRAQVSSGVPASSSSVTSRSCRVASPYPRGHQRAGWATVTSTTATDAPAATRPGTSLLAQPHRHSEIACRRADPGPLEVDVHRDGGRRVVVRHRDQRPHRGDPGHPPALDRHGLPEAGGLQVGPPVPPEAAGHLAHHVQRLRVGARPEADPGLLGLGVLERGREVDRQRHRHPARPLGGLAHVDPVGAVHVRRARHHDPAERDGRHRVDPGEHEVDPLVVRRRRQRDLGAVAPVRALHPGERHLAVVDVRVDDQPRVEQVGVHRSRYGRRHLEALEVGRHRAGRGATRQPSTGWWVSIAPPGRPGPAAPGGLSIPGTPGAGRRGRRCPSPTPQRGSSAG